MHVFITFNNRNDCNLYIFNLGDFTQPHTVANGNWRRQRKRQKKKQRKRQMATTEATAKANDKYQTTDGDFIKKRKMKNLSALTKIMIRFRINFFDIENLRVMFTNITKTLL